MTHRLTRAALAACTPLLLASCSNPAPYTEATQPVVVTGSRVQAAEGRPMPMPSPAPAAMPAAPALNMAPAPFELRRSAPVITGHAIMPAPSAERFPAADASKAILTAEQPVSTFSIDVDTASYAYVRRTLSAGAMPTPDSVRVEEMINYFPYRYPRPSGRGQPFAISTEVMPSPWDADKQLVHIALRGADVQLDGARPPINAVLLIDVSGSMFPPDRLPLLKRAFRLFAQQLGERDRVAIVTYASGTAVALEPTSGQERQKIVEAVEALGAGGGTAGADGLQRAYALAERHFDPKAVNRVILATDGDFNIGISDPRQLEQFIAAKRQSGVYLSILGVGKGNLNDALIQRLTQAGNGNAAYIDSLLEARKTLGDEFGSTLLPIANDVKVQVEFNPARVAAYRLVGYETRMLRRQDFNDDKIDAGDMGSGHTVTAIYEITPNGAGARAVDPLRYQAEKEAPAKAGGDELCFVKARYKLPGESTSRLLEHPVRAAAARKSLAAVPEDQRFAVAVAAFGQRLRGEAQASGMSYARIAELANTARGADEQGYRAEFVRLVRMAETLDNAGKP